MERLEGKGGISQRAGSESSGEYTTIERAELSERKQGDVSKRSSVSGIGDDQILQLGSFQQKKRLIKRKSSTKLSHHKLLDSKKSKIRTAVQIAEQNLSIEKLDRKRVSKAFIGEAASKVSKSRKEQLVFDLNDSKYSQNFLSSINPDPTSQINKRGKQGLLAGTSLWPRGVKPSTSHFPMKRKTRGEVLCMIEMTKTPLTDEPKVSKIKKKRIPTTVAMIDDKRHLPSYSKSDPISLTQKNPKKALNPLLREEIQDKEDLRMGTEERIRAVKRGKRENLFSGPCGSVGGKDHSTQGLVQMPGIIAVDNNVFPKTAQSLPRKLQSNFLLSHLNQVSNLPGSNSCVNPPTCGITRQIKGFLPFTAVDQAFMLKRPLFVRRTPSDPEKINDLSQQIFTNPALFDKSKHRLVYDSMFGHNHSIGDRDVQLQIPQSIRKQNGSHISEKSSKYFYNLQPFYQLSGPGDTTLIFESRFESGNLGRATQIGEFVYDLELRSDFNSFNPNMTQWFFFRIQNVQKDTDYTFNIINLFKPDSSYSQGMKPLAYSERHVMATGCGWYRTGFEIKYFQTPTKIRKISGNEVTNYTLSFKVRFDYDDDSIYLSHCYPYTFSDLMTFLNRICNPLTTKDRLKRTQLCRSIGGNSLDMLIITNLESSQDEIAERSAIIISS